MIDRSTKPKSFVRRLCTKTYGEGLVVLTQEIRRNKASIFLAFTLLLATTTAHAQKIFSANSYGAKPDGTTLNTIAIQKAIDTAAKSGGTVSFSPGTYLTGSLFLKSGITFEVPEGPTRIAGIEMIWPAALINARDQKDVVITGKGIIDGDGPIWWKSYWDLRAQYEPR